MLGMLGLFYGGGLRDGFEYDGFAAGLFYGRGLRFGMARCLRRRLLGGADSAGLFYGGGLRFGMARWVRLGFDFANFAHLQPFAKAFNKKF